MWCIFLEILINNFNIQSFKIFIHVKYFKGILRYCFIKYFYSNIKYENKNKQIDSYLFILKFLKEKIFVETINVKLRAKRIQKFSLIQQMWVVIT